MDEREADRGELKRRAAADLERFWDAYRGATTQHQSFEIAADWWKLSLKLPGITGAVAAGWARLGYLPEDAESLIRVGITAARVREMERHAEKSAGGGPAHVAQRIRDMVAAGEIVDPSRVIRIQDPDDPTREIITVVD